MKCLLIGSGGREHALAWSIAGSALTDELIIAPGSAAMANLGTCVDVAADDLDGCWRWQTNSARSSCGRAGSPACGWAGGRLEAAGHAAFGPSMTAAQLEGSKAFARLACDRHGIPQPGFTVVTALKLPPSPLQPLAGPV